MSAERMPLVLDPTHRETASAAKVMQALEGRDAVPVSTLAQLTGLTGQTIRVALAKLCANGLARRWWSAPTGSGNGCYVYSATEVSK